MVFGLIADTIAVGTLGTANPSPHGGILLVVPSGNDYQRDLSAAENADKTLPCGCGATPGVLCVTSTGKNGAISPFANIGAMVDVAAPGEYIKALDRLNNGIEYFGRNSGIVEDFSFNPCHFFCKTLLHDPERFIQSDSFSSRQLEDKVLAKSLSKIHSRTRRFPTHENIHS